MWLLSRSQFSLCTGCHLSFRGKREQNMNLVALLVAWNASQPFVFVFVLALVFVFASSYPHQDASRCWAHVVGLVWGRLGIIGLGLSGVRGGVGLGPRPWA